MQYLNFDLEIGPGSGREYPLVARSAAGEARLMLRFPFDDLALQNGLKEVEIALLSSVDSPRNDLRDVVQRVQNFGQALFESLFTDFVLPLYQKTQQEASKSRDTNVRLRLQIQAPELAVLPWEYLYDPWQGEYLCLLGHTPLVRYLNIPQPLQSLKVEPPLRILYMIANPSDQDQFDVETERKRIQAALSPLEAKGLVEIHWLDGQTLSDLQRAMRSGPWHIFHFIGHAGFDPRGNEGVVALVNDQGKIQLLSATELGRLLGGHRSLRFVFINASDGARGNQSNLFSSVAAVLARRGVPAVLAMQADISDRAANQLSRSFYEALADGMPLDGALTEARKAISAMLHNSLEWGTPVLYMSSEDGTLLELAQKPGTPAAVAGNEDSLAFALPKIPAPAPTTQEQPALSGRTRAFISYSHKDKRYLDELHAHLAYYVHTGVVDFWDDTKIPVGSKWRDEIGTALTSAKVAILLISADFLASGFIVNNELPPLLAAAEREGATIVPVILRTCGFEDTGLAQFQAVNAPSNALSKMTPGRRDEIWAKVAEVVKKLLIARS